MKRHMWKRILSFMIVIISMFSSLRSTVVAEGDNDGIVEETGENEVGEEDKDDTDVIVEEEIIEAVSYVGGTAGPNTFDCSGLVKYVFAHFGINLPHGTKYFAGNKYSSYGTKVSGTNNLQLGDLVFFGSSDDDLGHVGIYSGNG